MDFLVEVSAGTAYEERTVSVPRTPGVAAKACSTRWPSAPLATLRLATTCARCGSMPESVTKSLCTPLKRVCRAIAPATAAVTPLTMRAEALLWSWIRRVASCHATGPPRSRPTTDSTTQGAGR